VQNILDRTRIDSDFKEDIMATFEAMLTTSFTAFTPKRKDGQPNNNK